MRPEDPGPQLPVDQPSDYSYDLAHDIETPSARVACRAVGREGPWRSANPGDQDGDYSYDLAHEVPPA